MHFHHKGSDEKQVQRCEKIKGEIKVEQRYRGQDLGSKEKKKVAKAQERGEEQGTGKGKFGVREGGRKGKGGIAEKKIKLSLACKHLQMNYLDTDSLLLNTKHLINT